MVTIQKLYDSNGTETGAILTAIFNAPTDIQQKANIEKQLMDYAFFTLYPSQGISIYRNMYIDTPSITVIKNINNLPESRITI